MNMEEANSILRESSAEMLLMYLYPEMADVWTVHHEGTFYRNYSRDAMVIDVINKEVGLARDSMLKLLPQGVFVTENSLKGEDVREKYKLQEERRHLLNEAFLPFDTFNFRRRLRLEQKISETLDIRLRYILKTYFDFDIDAESNPYVREAAIMLPFVSHYRADYPFIKTMLAALTNHPVEMQFGRYSETDSARQWLPMVKYKVLIEGLDVNEYQQITQELQPLAAFLREWLIPVDVKCMLSVKEHRHPQKVNGRLVLDYNTEIE
jgi:hypothetical protein